MTTMRAVSLRDGMIALRTLPMPVPGEGQVLVKTLACAICASDHHSIHSATAHLKGIDIQFGGGPSIADWYETMDLVSRGVIDPTPLVGEVVPLDGLADAFERARSSSGPVRIVHRA